jgi:hypothetical protein
VILEDWLKPMGISPYALLFMPDLPARFMGLFRRQMQAA